MNMRQSAGWLAVIVVLLAGMSLVARSSPPAVSDAGQAGEVAMGVTINCGKTEPPFAFEVTPMTDWITDLDAILCLKSMISIGQTSRVDLDGDGVDGWVIHLFDLGVVSVRWIRITSEGMLETTDFIFTAELFDLPSLGGNEVYLDPSPRAFEDLNGDGLPDLIFEAAVTTSGGSFIRSRFFYSLNTSTPPQPPLVGDVDGDGIVGILDFLLVLENWTV